MQRLGNLRQTLRTGLAMPHCEADRGRVYGCWRDDCQHHGKVRAHDAAAGAIDPAVFGPGLCRHGTRSRARGLIRSAGRFDRFFQTEGADHASGYGIGLALVHEIVTRERAPVASEPVMENPDQRWRRRLGELIAQHLDGPALSVEALAGAMHADRSSLLRRCKELIGVSPSEYVRETRLRRAHGLLGQGSGSISQITYAVGFDSLSSFTRAFKARCGFPPS